MTSQQLRTLIHQDPRRPFRLVLDDGEEIVVKEPRKALVAGEDVACEGETHRQGTVLPPKLRILRVDCIVAAEEIPPGS